MSTTMAALLKEATEMRREIAMLRPAPPAPSAKAAEKGEIGSDTPKNIKPMPMPAANSIASQPE